MQDLQQAGPTKCRCQIAFYLSLCDLGNLCKLRLHSLDPTSLLYTALADRPILFHRGLYTGA